MDKILRLKSDMIDMSIMDKPFLKSARVLVCQTLDFVQTEVPAN